MMHRRLALATLPLIAVAAAAQSSDWPGFRGPGRDGVAHDAQPPLEWSDTDNIRWKTKLPGPGASSPIVLGNHVYVACYTGYGAHLDDLGDKRKLVHHLVCVDRDDGEVVWDCTVPGPLDHEARQVQINEHGFASPTPETDGETIYAYFGSAGVVAIDLDGKIKWHADTGVPPSDADPATNQVIGPNEKPLDLHWGAAASPLLWGELVIVNASEESSSIRALDKRTGELVWQRISANLEGSAISPLMVGETGSEVLIIALGGEVWGLTPKTGEVLWQVETDSRGGMSPTPVAAGDVVYTFGGEGDSFALRHGADVDADARVVWKGENLGIPSPVLHDGLLFLVRTNGIAACLDADDGSVLFSGRLEGRTGSLYASPVLAGGHLYVQSRKRGTFVYKATEEMSLVARNQLDDDTRFNASPAIAGSEMFLRSDAYLYCVGS